MSPTGLPPRRAALALLQQISTEGRVMSELLGGPILEGLAPEDRARAQRLALDALRGRDRADRMLAPYLKRTPPEAVRNALRLGVVELCSGEAAHGVVNAYVELVARNKRTAGLRGMVNAVLRRIADEGPAGWAARPVPLTPGWLRQPLVAAWGRAAVSAMEAVHFAGAPLDLTARTDPQAVAAMVGGVLLPTGSVRLADAGQVTALPGYDSGDWWVQDAAAALPVQLLGDVAGCRVLDLCAAPGGKTLQLAARGARVTAVDVNAGRLGRLRDNLDRVGLQAEVIVSDAFDVAPGGWDAVLLDVPCSATGTLRRHPDLAYAKDGSDFGALIDQQAAMIDHALTLVRPGGTVLFCTCSLLPDEGEVQVEEALTRHPGVTLDRACLDRPGIDPAWVTLEGGLRLRPDYWADLGGMDGFYMAALRVPG